MELHPQIIEKEGINEFVVLPYKEYLVLTELIHDYEDLRATKEQSKGDKSITLNKAISELGL